MAVHPQTYWHANQQCGQTRKNYQTSISNILLERLNSMFRVTEASNEIACRMESTKRTRARAHTHTHLNAK